MTQVTLKITKSVGFKHLEVIHKNNSLNQEVVLHTQNVERMWVSDKWHNRHPDTTHHLKSYLSTEQQEYFLGTLYIVVNYNKNRHIPSVQLVYIIVYMYYNLQFVTLKITLCKVQPRVISFEEQVASIRQHLADIYEREQSWREAANVLVGIPLETGQK